MGTRSEAGPVLILVAGLFLYQWWQSPSLDVEESVRGFAHDTGAVFILAADEIDAGKIKSDAEWHKFVEDRRKEAAALNFAWIGERMHVAVESSKGKWEPRSRSAASREIGKQLGGD